MNRDKNDRDDLWVDANTNSLASKRARNSSSTSIKESFSALWSIGAYKKDLRGKRNELEALRARVKNDKLIQKDNHEILINYDSIMNEQQAILGDSSGAKDKAQAQKRVLESELKPWENKYADMKEQHRKVLKPLQDAYDAAKSGMLDIEDELALAKREYDSLEKQLRRANDEKRGTLELKFSAQKPIVETWEIQRSSAVNLKNQAEVELENRQSEFARLERPIEAEIDRLKGLITIEKATIEDTTNKVDNAKKRIDYARHVKDNPDETRRLGDLILKNEAYEIELTQIVANTQAMHDNLKKQSLKAKILLVAGLIVLLAVVGVIVFFTLKANGVI